MVERVTVIKCRMDNGGDNGASCFEVEIRADTAKFTNVIVAGFRKCRDLVGEGKVFIKDEAKVASKVGCNDKRVVNFRKLLFKSDKKKLSFRRVESECLQYQYVLHCQCKSTGFIKTDFARNRDNAVLAEGNGTYRN